MDISSYFLASDPSLPCLSSSHSGVTDMVISASPSPMPPLAATAAIPPPISFITDFEQTITASETSPLSAAFSGVGISINSPSFSDLQLDSFIPYLDVHQNTSALDTNSIAGHRKAQEESLNHQSAQTKPVQTHSANTTNQHITDSNLNHHNYHHPPICRNSPSSSASPSSSSPSNSSVTTEPAATAAPTTTTPDHCGKLASKQLFNSRSHSSIARSTTNITTTTTTTTTDPVAPNSFINTTSTTSARDTLDTMTTNTDIDTNLMNVCAHVNDDVDLTGTLTSFVVDTCDPLACSTTSCGHDSDAGYVSGVDPFSTSPLGASGVDDRADSIDDAYCFQQFSLDSSPITTANSSKLCSDKQHQHNHLQLHNQTHRHHHHLHQDHSHSFMSSSHHPHLDDIYQISSLHHNHLSAMTTPASLNSSTTFGSGSSYSDILNSNDYFVNITMDGGGYGSSSSSSGFSDNYDCISDRNQSLESSCSLLSHINNNSSVNLDHYNLNYCSNESTLFNGSNNNIKMPTYGNPQQQRRSVLMNLLIDGSDVGAGYTNIDCRPSAKRHLDQESSIYSNNLM